MFSHYNKIFSAIQYHITEEVRTHVGKDNEFTTLGVLDNLPGDSQFAGYLKEAMSLIYTDVRVGAHNKSLHYLIGSEYAYAPSSGYPKTISNGNFNKTPDYEFVIFYFGFKSSQNTLQDILTK